MGSSCEHPVRGLAPKSRLPLTYDLGSVTHMDRTQQVLPYEADFLNEIQVRY